MTVDPRIHEGERVAKSEQNAEHDGRIEMGPLLHRKDGVAYQRLVDNSVSPQLCVDYRVSVIDRQLPTALSSLSTLAGSV